jgi:co-chaperonin GroES (HSP10)|tara:strand:+ start:15 stop:401 length:387 start_codon:yes stop_codon:yes gene_type:complete
MTVKAVKEKEVIEEDSNVASQLPEPQGYKILIALPEVDEKTEGGIIKADTTVRVEETASIIGFVLKMGPDCYKDEKRFPNGAYCEEGDFIIMRAYSGTRMKIHGKEFRLINDDTVEAVVRDPTGIVRA